MNLEERYNKVVELMQETVGASFTMKIKSDGAIAVRFIQFNINNYFTSLDDAWEFAENFIRNNRRPKSMYTKLKRRGIVDERKRYFMLVEKKSRREFAKNKK